MSAAGAEDIRKHVRTYIAVFVALLVLTVITVGVSYLHLPIWQAVLVAMLVASIKGTLVATFFMHLISERSAVYWVLIVCVTMFVFLMLGPVLTDSEMETIAQASPAATAQLETHAPSH
jgi:cytochrome c oxidase subunit 4